MKICRLSEVTENEPLKVEVRDMFLMVKVPEQIFVTDTFCTHEKADLSLGILSEVIISCPLHQAKFDLRDGKVLEGPNGTEPNTVRNLRTYPAKAANDELWVDQVERKPMVSTTS